MPEEKQPAAEAGGAVTRNTRRDFRRFTALFSAPQIQTEKTEARAERDRENAEKRVTSEETAGDTGAERSTTDGGSGTGGDMKLAKRQIP
ncbi:hypothetical protein KCP74_20405 [Salmonella enterica subsp. enterica]|nr:hypothetical protein KCP74_20405 [Salmonella enterica subsp. enterica]